MSGSSTNTIRTDYAKSVRPEPVEGLGGVIAESVETQISPSTSSGRTVQSEDDFVSFTLALGKYKKSLLTISCDLSKAANRIPLLLATYILENLEALFDLKQSQTILPLYTLLRSAMEASFRLAYIAGDSGSFERHKRIFLASIEDAEKENAEWRKAKLVPDGKVQAVFEQFTSLKQSLTDIKKAPTVEQIFKCVCKEKENLQDAESGLEDVLFSQWYGLYRNFSGVAHGRVHSLDRHYTGNDVEIVVIKENKLDDLEFVYGVATQLLDHIAGPALAMVFKTND